MALDLPDGLNMMEETEGALDPFFGVMASHQLPSPYKIAPVRSPRAHTHTPPALRGVVVALALAAAQHVKQTGICQHSELLLMSNI